jgi:predicted DNA-binding protein with PD1-like motif
LPMMASRQFSGEGGVQVRSTPSVVVGESAARMWAFRLPPGADLKRELASLVVANSLQAAFVAACVGSLAKARLRLPSAVGESSEVLSLDEPTEIVSLAGTLSPEGLHLHIALAGRDGQCVGGHVVDGCIVHTTAEILLGELTDLAFRRLPDAETGYRELSVGRRDRGATP